MLKAGAAIKGHGEFPGYAPGASEQQTLNRCSIDLSEMKSWYHFLPISLAMHASLFGLACYCIPDTPAFQIFALESGRTERVIHFEEAEIYDDLTEEMGREEAVSEEEDPFEQQDVEIVQPEIHFETPENRKESPVSEPEVTEDAPKAHQPEPKQEAESREETANEAENVRDVLMELPHSTEALSNDKAQGDGHADAANASEGGAAAGSAMNANARQEAEAHGNSASNAGGSSPKADETELWKAYTQTLSNHFKQHKRYPEMAKRLRLTGTVWLLVEIDRHGNILSAEIAQSSGVEILDEAALSSAKDAGPVPKFPEGVSVETKKLRIPYNYRLK